MAEGGEDARRENQRRLVVGEPVEEILEEGADFTQMNEGQHLTRLAEPGGRTYPNLERNLLITYVISAILLVSGIVNFAFLFYKNLRVVGSVGVLATGFFSFVAISMWTNFNQCKRGKRGGKTGPAGNPILQELGRTETARVRSPSGQVPAIDAGNPSAPPPGHFADPAVAGPSGLQSPVRPAPSEHSYRILRSGKKISVSEERHSERQSVLQAPVSEESSATSKISEVALSLSELAARGISRGKRNSPSRKASIHEESIPDDSDDSTSD